ncbi:serine carboxypeptidase [Coniochaeta sp. 2T2.1]|nr:serine carboxypeptidase [Coniochaeta sp. 2T2.1]
MKFVTALVLSATCVSAVFDWRSISERYARPETFGATAGHELPKRQSTTNSTSKFLTDKTREFAVNGALGFDFDVGESYAGSLPVGDSNPGAEMFYWFFPSVSEEAETNKEILFWVTGGPGCSSVGELLQENGPFLWQPGTFGPTINPWSWHRLTSVVWIDQPVGAGFSTGNATARNEQDVAEQFMGFWKNFVDMYALQGYKIYVAGSSYSGMYCPYIASAMLDANDPTYFNVSGMMIFDGTFANTILEQDVIAADFHDQWENVIAFNDSFKAELRGAAQDCGYTDYINEFLVFPAKGQQPAELPGALPDGSAAKPGCDLLNLFFAAGLESNPCFSPYDITIKCPRKFDPLGFADGSNFMPNGSTVYFDRADVKAAIHAPDKAWAFCSSAATGQVDVFVNGTDESLVAGPGSQPVLPNVIDKTQNVIIAHGSRDWVLMEKGVLMAFQNITWGGKLGFESNPRNGSKLIMPAMSDAYTLALQNIGAVVGLTVSGGQGTVGVHHTERGLTYLGLDVSGHFLSMNAPEVAFRALEVLLGRVDGVRRPEAVYDGHRVHSVRCRL